MRGLETRRETVSRRSGRQRPSRREDRKIVGRRRVPRRDVGPVPIERSSWVALRDLPLVPYEPRSGWSSTTSRCEPPGKSAEWCLKGVDTCWRNKEPSIRPSERAEAKAAYDKAREAYRAIKEECETE